MRRPTRGQSWRLREHFVFTGVITTSLFILLSIVQSLQPPTVEAACAAAVMALPRLRLRPRHAYRRAGRVRLAMFWLARWCRAHWLAGLLTLVAVDVVLGGLVLRQAGHELAAMALVYGALLAALGWIAWLVAASSPAAQPSAPPVSLVNSPKAEVPHD